MITTQKAVGFRIQKRTARLMFEETEYDGAEVVVRLDVPVKMYMDIQDLVEEEKHLQVFTLFGDSVLDSWNLQNDEGISIPASSDGMNMIPMDLANIILNMWVEVSTQPSAHLENS
jgi:hypothetical protein